MALGLVAGSVGEAKLLGRGPDVAGDVVHRVVGHFRAAAGESTPSGQELERQGEPEAVAVAPLCDQRAESASSKKKNRSSSGSEGSRRKRP